MKRLALLVIALLLVAAVCWFVLAGCNARQSPRSLALPDGTKLRILAVTYGTNHTIGTRLGQFIADLPSPLERFLKSLLGARALPRQTIIMPTPGLMVWVSRQTNSLAPPTTSVAYFRAFLGDGSNFMSGQDAFVNTYMPGIETEGLHFGVFPRRDREITLNVFSYDSKGLAHLCGSLPFTNPFYRDYAEWKPEPLPATKRTGDLEVTLRMLETGHGQNVSFVVENGVSKAEYTVDRDDGQNHTAVDLAFRPLENTNEVWQIAGVEVSDATGNKIHNMSMNSSGSSFAFAPSLWPREKAWKLKLELKRTRGFRPAEMFTFHNVPLGELNRTNAIGWKTNIGDVTVTFASFARRAPWTNAGWESSDLSNARFNLFSPPEGMQLDLLWMVCDTGETNESTASGFGGYEHDYEFLKIPLAARTADFVFTLQKSRFVEFTVKPQLPKPPAKNAAPK